VTAALALLLAPVPAGSHPGHGPPVVNVGQFKYAPQVVNVVEGDYVFWAWSESDTNHTVTADSGQSMTFDSDPGKTSSEVSHKTGDGFSAQFKKAGTYTYHCKVHSFMTGTVNVAALPDSSKPQPATKPVLHNVAVALAGRRLTVRFRVNEAVSIRAIVRHPSGRSVKEFDFPGPPGSNKRVLKLSKVRSGHYVLALVAIDSSSGLSSKTAKRSFTLR